MSLPAAWIDKIFQKLSLTFGRDFLGRWEGIDIEDVKTDWAHELRGLEKNPASIAYGLEVCANGKAPTVQEFKAACLRKSDVFVALPSPAADAVIVRQELAKMGRPILRPTGNKDWAYSLQARHKAGDKLGMMQVQMYEQALRLQA